jgi:hypothetical protein
LGPIPNPQSPCTIKKLKILSLYYLKQIIKIIFKRLKIQNNY